MQQLSLTGVERIQYEQGINASNLQLADIYGQIQDKQGALVDQAVQADQDDWKAFLEKSPSSSLQASGRTGKSIDRISSLDLAEYLTNSSRRARELTNASKELRSKGQQAAGQAAAQQKQMWAQQAFVKMPDFAPPPPVMQNVGSAAFMDAISIATPIVGMFAGSDRKIKENIKKLGESISGLGIYKFNYKGDSTKWIGTMADEVKKIKPEAVTTMKNGYEGVRYDLIDVQFKEIV